jgi:hypothetical protein
MEEWQNSSDRRKPVEKPLPVKFYPPEVPHTVA